MFKNFIAAFAFALVSTAASAQIQDKPVLLGDVDYYALEVSTEAAWKEALPKLKKNFFDYMQAWERLKSRKSEIQSKWFGLHFDAPVLSTESKLFKDMYEWCGNAGIGKTPADDDKTAFLFAQLDVRVRLCEEKLPLRNEKVSLPTSNDTSWDTRPAPFPNKVSKKKASKRR